MGAILAIKRDISIAARIVIPQRDVVGRLAQAGVRPDRPGDGVPVPRRLRPVRRACPRTPSCYQDRVTGILDAHLARVSNQLAQVSKLLAVIAALFGPLTVITGLYGMNVPLPSLVGEGTAQFWEIVGVMTLSSLGMYWWFKKSGWL
jgi:magnesium transporter